MDYFRSMNAAIEFIEENLEKELTMKEVAGKAFLSKYHFQRMFSMIAGISIGEYIRNRRLTCAAKELATTNTKVIDIALKYGYASPESFSKAFSKFNGFPPSKIGNKLLNIKATPRLTFQITIKGAEEMEYKIIELEAFHIIGKSMRVSTINGENFVAIPKFWQTFNASKEAEVLSKHCGEMGMLGVCMDHVDHEITYMIAIEKPKGNLSLEFEETRIPASTWAVFKSVGPMPGAIQAVVKKIFSEWFPSTGYEHADAPELEVYPLGDPNGENYVCEIWMPITKK